MKKIRKCLLPILFAICFALFGAGLFGISAKTAKADSPFTLAGASIRYVSSAGDDQGIRFVANADKAEFNALASGSENLSVKVVIASLPNVKNAGINPEELDINSAIFKHVISVYEKENGNVTKNIWSEEENVLTANIYIWKIPESAYHLFWVARMYYTTGIQTGYSDNIVNKSMSEVALDNYDQATPEQQTKLNEFMKNHTVIWFDDKGAEIKTDFEQKYGEKLSAPSVYSLRGFNAVWYKRTGTDTNNNPIWSDIPYDVETDDSLVRSDTHLKLAYEIINYNITYSELTGPYGTETVNNPAVYNVESSSITINSPTESKNYFTGWTYEGQTTPVKNPTIPAGSIGDKTFTANWGDFTKPDDDFIYMGYYGLLRPKSVSGYNVTENDIIYTSGNTSIATVSGHKINSAAVGSATITAKLGGISKTFTVTVKATSETDGENNGRTMDTDTARHNNCQEMLEVSNYSDNPTFFIGDSFMDERWFFTDFYSRFATKNAHLLGISSSRASHWRFFVQDYLVYEPKNIVIHIGTNDLFDGNSNVSLVVKYVKNLFDVIHESLPSTRVYYWSVEDRYTVSNWSRNKGTEINEINGEIKNYAKENSSWLTLVNTRGMLVSADDYKEKSGTTIHPSIPLGYDKCMRATFDAGLNLTENAYASTNIVKDWTSVNGTDNFASAKVMGMQARVNNFVWESDITINDFSNTGAKGHITVNWKTPTEVGGRTDGLYNRFVILNKSSGNNPGKFYFLGNTPSFNAWSNVSPDYFEAVSGTPTTFKLAILVTDTDAYMFYNDILVAVYMNVNLGAVNNMANASYNAFRVGGELATVDFRNNKISTPHLNPSVYQEYLNRGDVAHCDADTSISTQELLYRETSFDVYSNAHFVVNGVTVTLTDTSTGRNYIGVVEDDKLKLFTGTAGALVGGTYDVTTHISGLNFKLYTNATVSVSGGYTVAGESEIKFDIFSASWNTIKDRTESGQYNINLKEGTFDKRLATYENNDFHADMSFRTSALKETLPDEFYAVTFIKGDLTENTGGFRVGIRTAAASTDYTASLMQNPGGIPIVQETDSWYNWGAYDKTSLKNYGYWLVVHYDAVNHQKTTYLSDEDGNYLEKRATVTRETIYTSDLDAIGIKMWAANGNANYPAIPYTVNTTALRFGTSLTGAFNRSVSVDILNTANCSASVTDYSVFAGSPAGSDLYSIKPDRGYQVSAVEINDIALPCPYHDCYLIKDTVFTPVISTIAERIDLTDADITNSGAANSVTSYNSRIGVSEFTWQGFIGFPKDTSLDLSVSAKWNVCVMFYTDVKPNGAPQVQLLRWNNSVYIKAFRDSSNATALATTINDNPEIMETLIEDKGLNVRVVFYGNKISVYVLAGAGRTKWYQTHDRFEIATEGSFVNKISNYKDLSDISSIDAIVKNASVITYAEPPQDISFKDVSKGSSGPVSEYNEITVPDYDKNVIAWTGFIGFNVTAGANSPLWTEQNYLFSEVKLLSQEGLGLVNLQLLSWGGTHSLKVLYTGSYEIYRFHDYGSTSLSSYETYLRNNGGLYVALAYDKINGTASLWAMNNMSEWRSLITNIHLNLYGANVKYVSWWVAQENECISLDMDITDSFLKNQRLSFYDVMPIAVSNIHSIDLDVNDTVTVDDSRGIYNNSYTLEKGYKYHFVQALSIKDYPSESYAYDYNGNPQGFDVWYVPTSSVRFYSRTRTDNVECQILNWRGWVAIKFIYGYTSNTSVSLYFDSVTNTGLYKDWTSGLYLTIDIVMYIDDLDRMWAEAYVYDAHGTCYTVSTAVRPFTTINNVNTYWDEGPNAFKVNGFRMIRNNKANPYLADADIISNNGVIYRVAES